MKRLFELHTHAGVVSAGKMHAKFSRRMRSEQGKSWASCQRSLMNLCPVDIDIDLLNLTYHKITIMRYFVFCEFSELFTVLCRPAAGFPLNALFPAVIQSSNASSSAFPKTKTRKETRCLRATKMRLTSWCRYHICGYHGPMCRTNVTMK